MKCERCNGTGWASAAKDAGMSNVPDYLKPIGVYRCYGCDGTGKIGYEGVVVFKKFDNGKLKRER